MGSWGECGSIYVEIFKESLLNEQFQYYQH